MIDHSKVTDVVVPTEQLDGDIRLEGADGANDGAERTATCCWPSRVVAEHDEQVNRLVEVDGILEPGFLDHGGCRSDLGRIGVACEVIENAKGHDAEPVLGSEISVLLPDVFEFSTCRVDKLDVTGDIFVTVVFRDDIEGLI